MRKRLGVLERAMALWHMSVPHVSPQVLPMLLFSSLPRSLLRPPLLLLAIHSDRARRVSACENTIAGRSVCGWRDFRALSHGKRATWESVVLRAVLSVQGGPQACSLVRRGARSVTKRGTFKWGLQASAYFGNRVAGPHRSFGTGNPLSRAESCFRCRWWVVVCRARSCRYLVQRRAFDG